MDVSENSGTPKSSILIGFSIINHPFWGTPIFGNTHIEIWGYSSDRYACSSRRSHEADLEWWSLKQALGWCCRVFFFFAGGFLHEQTRKEYEELHPGVIPNS